MTMRLRAATADDLGVIAEAQEETARVTRGRAPREDERDERARATAEGVERGEVVLADDGGAVVGYCWVTERAGAPFVVDIHVTPSARRRGVAGRLLAAALEPWIRGGATEARLAIADRNDASVRFFAARGASAVGEPSADGVRDYVLPLRP